MSDSPSYIWCDIQQFVKNLLQGVYVYFKSIISLCVIPWYDVLIWQAMLQKGLKLHKAYTTPYVYASFP